MHRLLAVSCAVVSLAVVFPVATRAESWCAEPLWVHEWGVQVFSGGSVRRLTADALPSFFHLAPPSSPGVVSPVRGLPVDGGERELPVVHFYSPGMFSPVPVGLEVGFAQGEASAWFPQVDQRRSAADANGAQARTRRAQLLRDRAARTRTPFGAPAAAALPADPTRQLVWDALTLTTDATHAPAASTIPWVSRLRGLDGALWASNATESERFVFYEGRTTETAAITLAPGPTSAPGRHHVLLRNTSARGVFDVFLIHRDAGRVFVVRAPAIPARSSAGFVLEDHAMTPATAGAELRAALRAQLVDAQQPRPGGAGGSDCVMQRDPAQPVESAEGHRLYEGEADALLSVWAARFFDAPGTTLVYREDTHTLDELMPISVYTDMYHFVRLRRAGLVLVEGVVLP